MDGGTVIRGTGIVTEKDGHVSVQFIPKDAEIIEVSRDFIWDCANHINELEDKVQRVLKVLKHPRDYRGPGSEWNECREVVLRILGGGA
jgi:hypothetical protein